MGDLPLRTPTDRRHGGPLPRRLTNRTHVHPQAINLYPSKNVPNRYYAVLIFLSEGYPPPEGRLHTRYSPVRRSPPEVLPLDLHVLGLSLAFILSQDQTLRCTFLLSLLLPQLPYIYKGKGGAVSVKSEKPFRLELTVKLLAWTDLRWRRPCGLHLPDDRLYSLALPI